MALLSSALSAAPGPAAADRAPDDLARGAPAELHRALSAALGAEGVLGRASDLVRYASDASPYRRFPKAVVQPTSEREIAAVFECSRRSGEPVVFRGGGTSLNGQSQGDGILLDMRRHWRGIEVLEDGAATRLRPGSLLGEANAVLAPHGRRLGPDPASKDIATVGGVLANNSGGMRCGTTADAYATLRSLRFVLPSGTVIDTAEAGAAERFEAAEPRLCSGLAEIRDEIRADGDLRERIRRKFEIKNTMGYRLCAFLDADEPLEIFKLLLVGSEGTLAFVSEATLETVAVPAATTLAWAHLPSIDAATAPVGALVEAGASAVEMMVAPALMVAANSIPGAPPHWSELPPDSAALLVELGAEDPAGLERAEAAAEEALVGHELLRPLEWAREAATIELFWRVREGMHGLVGRLRPPGTALIVEDVCVAPERLAECATELQALLAEHGFLTGVAGHASVGNLHFMLTPDFAEPEDRERYGSFIEAMAELIVDRYDGSLKAEHGTGVNMAPFLEREWGPRATELMWRVKELADPEGLLGPGVVLNRDPACHLENLKTTPAVEESVTACVECGFCEPACPSRDLTTTPRQRIVLRREMARQPAGSPVLEALAAEFEYDGLRTCAADGSCALACPLGIDTGEMVVELRSRQRSQRTEALATEAARSWAAVERSARAGLGAGAALSRALGDRAPAAVSELLRAGFGEELVPAWVPPMPPPAGAAMPPTVREGAAAVYLPACINRIFGASHDPDRGWLAGLPDALVAVSERAGSPVWIPPDLAGHCCGTPWSSKGYERGHSVMATRTVDALWRWSDGGALPIVVDATSCTQGLVEAPKNLDRRRRELHAELEMVDSVEWARRLLPELEIDRRLDSVALHPTCASRRLGLAPAFAAVAAELADRVLTPATAGCCGFAGDRGFLHPELPAAALAEEARELADIDADAHLCANRTCEIGLARETGRDYASLIYLLEERTR